MVQVFFTFKTFSDAGIGDQLGAQFAHLFALGNLCGWTYVHLAPIRFNRKNLGARHSKSNEPLNLYNVACFLGLNLQAKKPLVDDTIVVSLSHLICNACSLSEVNDRVQGILKKPKLKGISAQDNSISVLLEIELDNNYHALIPNIEALANMSWTQVLQYSGAIFLQRQLGSKFPISHNLQPYAVAHVRIGDSIRIDTPYCPVILHGREVYTSLLEYRKAVGLVDPGRQPYFNPFDLSAKIDNLLLAKGFKRESLIIVSDGFDTTKACIWAHMRSRRLKLRIGISALRAICRLESMFFGSIKDISLSRRIIGEDSYSTLESIKLFSNAAFLMCNSGSFSNVIFNLYNPIAQSQVAFSWL